MDGRQGTDHPGGSNAHTGNGLLATPREQGSDDAPPDRPFAPGDRVPIACCGEDLRRFKYRGLPSGPAILGELPHGAG